MPTGSRKAAVRAPVAAKRAKPLPNFSIVDAMTDPALFGRHFDGESWGAWRAFLKAMFALPMSKAEREIFEKHTQRSYNNATAAEIMHAVLICGRRSGKSRVLALIGVYLAVMVDWSARLSAGETGTVMILAASKDQAKVIYKYCLGLLQGTPIFERLIKKATASVITLSNGIEIRITAASFRTTRGVTAVAVLMDEVAFWWSDPNAAESDIEIARALKPATMTVRGSRTLIASSPYRRTGLLWNERERLYGKEVPGEMCWIAETRQMNPEVSQSEVDSELLKDYEAAKSEYLAIFRDDLEAFISRDILEPITMRGVREIPPEHGVTYLAGFDGAGGEKRGGDSMCCSIAHWDTRQKYTLVDAMREVQPKFSPSVVIADFCKLFRQYRITRVFADRWARGVLVEMFAAHGITLVPTEMSASDYFGELLPAMTSGTVRILDSERLTSQFMQLERRTSSFGKDNIGHPTRGNFHDDLAVAVAISLVSAKAKRGPMKISDSALQESQRRVDYRNGDLGLLRSSPNTPLYSGHRPWGPLGGKVVR